MNKEFGATAFKDSWKYLWKYIVMIAFGVLVYFLFRKILSEALLKIFLFLYAAFKVFIFSSYSFKQIIYIITKTKLKTIDLFFSIGFTIFLILASFAFDYLCMRDINAATFKGIPESYNYLKVFCDFFYLSASIFSTAGFGNIAPEGLYAKGIVVLEVANSVIIIVFALTNFANYKMTSVKSVNEMDEGKKDKDTN